MGSRNTNRIVTGLLGIILGMVIIVSSVHDAKAQPSSPPPEKTLPNISLGSFKVSNTGAANYTIPIIVPPGTNGMQPNLSLVYSSQTQNSILGIGWSLNGISVIHRCARTKVQDNVRGGINLDTNDRFCLNGARLMVISGTYGADGAEYRTELDSFVKIFSRGQVAAPGSGPQYFTVQTKDGQFQEFGNTADSRIEASATNATVRLWLLNKVKDSSDNYMIVTYQEDTANGDYRPLQIDYTGNTTQSFSSQRSVKFFYSDRTDKPPLYVGGVATGTTKLLTAIETWAPPPQGGAAVRVRQYQMTYAKGDNTYRNHLASVTECSATSPTTLTCLQPFTFTYQDAQTGFTSPFPTWPVTFPISNAQLQTVGDFNGDGKADILAWKDSTHVRMFLSTGSGFTEQTWTATLHTGSYNYVGDFNGDGKADVLVRSGSSCILYTSTGTSFTSSGTITCKINTTNPKLNFVGDFDGDGRDDIASIGVVGAAVWMNLSTGTGFASPQAWSGCGNTTNPGLNFVGDFNGDGIADLATNNCVSLSTGSNLVFASGWTIPSPGLTTNGHLYVGDFNGDGKTDFLSEDINNPGSSILFLSTGTRFVKATGLPAPMTGTLNFVGDFNGDGRTDLITAVPANGQPGHCQFAFSTGDGFHGVLQPNGSMIYTNYDCWLSDAANGWNFVGDFNGDGRMDIYNEAGSSQHMNLALDAVPDVVTSMNNNIGGKIDITYKPITDTTIYTKDTDATFPVMDVQAHIFRVPIYMVTSNINKTRADGTGQNFNYTYTYQGLKFHKQGRAGLGYRIMNIVDQTAAVNPNNAASKKQIINYFNQTFPFTGLLARTDSIDTQSPTLLFNQTLNTYEDMDTHPGLTLPSGDKRTRFPRLKQTDKLECDQQPTCFQVEDIFTHDINGNLTQTQYVGDISITGDERTEATDFISDTTNWLFKPKRMVLKNDLGQTIREKWLYYDDQNLPGQFGNFGTPPRGRLTMEENRLVAISGGDDHGSAGNAFTTYTNDGFGNRLTVKNPIDCTTTTAYDTLTHTFPITTTNCLGLVTKNTSDPRFGVKLTETDPNDSISNPVVTIFEYDTFGRLTKKTGPLDSSSQFGSMSFLYNNFGDPTTQHVQTLTTKEHGTATVIAREDYFDGLGRFYKNESDAPAGKTIIEKFTYDSRSLLTERVAHQFTDDLVALPPTKYFYDVLGRQVLLTRPDDTPSNPRRVMTAFFPREMQVTDENGHQQVKFFDAYQQLEQVDEMKIVLGVPQVYATTLYDYDAAGQLIHVENDQHHNTRVKYDFLGRKTVLCDPNLGAGPNTATCDENTAGAWLYTYDKAGNLTSQKDAVLRSLGQQLTFQNDQLGRITIKTYPNSATITYTYDQGVNGIGRVSQVADLGGVVTSYTYDKMGRTIQTDRTIDGILHTLTQSYNALSEVVSETHIDNQQTGDTFDYAYDEAGRLSTVLNYINSIKYNARGQKTEIDYFNNVVSTFTYFDQVVAGQKINFRVKNHTTTGPSPAFLTLQNLDYTYDNVGNMTSIIDHVNSATRDIIEYDDQNRMTRARGNFGTNQSLQDCGYDYDTIGNITNKCGITYTYGDANHPSFATATSDGKTYNPDMNGNTLTSTDRSFSWTADNHASSITFNGSTTTMDYDYSGARLKKFGPLGQSVFPFGTYEIDPTGTKIKYIPLGNDLLAAKKSSGEKMFYHNDHLGGVNVITDAGAAQTELMEYDPWGKLSKSVTNGSAIDPIHGYTGQELDTETDLYSYGGRYYDPQLARFVQPDPFVTRPAQPQEFNRYSYALNSPYRYIDPTGYDETEEDDNGGGGTGGNSFSDERDDAEHGAGRSGPSGAKGSGVCCDAFEDQYVSGSFFDPISTPDVRAYAVLNPTTFTIKDYFSLVPVLNPLERYQTPPPYERPDLPMIAGFVSVAPPPNPDPKPDITLSGLLGPAGLFGFPIGPKSYGAGYGQFTGATTGWAIGTMFGSALGRGIGYDLGWKGGAVLGALITAPSANPAVVFAGTMVVGYVGGKVGGAIGSGVGGLIGGFLGSNIGGIIGHTFDSPSSGKAY